MILCLLGFVQRVSLLWNPGRLALVAGCRFYPCLLGYKHCPFLFLDERGDGREYVRNPNAAHGSNCGYPVRYEPKEITALRPLAKDGNFLKL